jgi:tetratricopeptide (TPR) repeat protein
VLCNTLRYHLNSIGDLAGAPYYECALAICEKALGPDHPDTANRLNNLGALLQAMGDLAGALPYVERAMALLTARLRPDNPHTQNVRRNFAALPGG